MKSGKLFACLCACAMALILTDTAISDICAEDIPKAVLIGQIGENEIWDDGTDGAESPEITGDAVYSAFLPLKYSDSVEFLALDIEGVSTSVYENLSVTVEKIRIDGKDYPFSETPVVNTDYVNAGFSGTRVYIVDSWEGNLSVLPTKTTFAESVEVIFKVSGTGKKGSDFVDKRAPEDNTEASTEPETQPQTEVSETTSEEAETEPATGGVQPVSTDITETTAVSETSVTSTTSAAALTTVSLPTVTKEISGIKSRTIGRTSGSAPVTGEKSVAIAFAGLIITAGAAILTKIKRK
ncbi:hypothetical protein [Porcipelethomonas sp.]|uniref:hypothetical protein n=1 Tax=Porcipelethomonas sp. TaxID=2981675 RepID=UPI003EFAF1EB